MNERIKIDLPTGAVLSIQHPPFAEAKKLSQVMLRELKGIEIKKEKIYADVFKDAICLGFSSPEIDEALAAILKRCTYKDARGEFKITEDLFENVKVREDYLVICVEVCKAVCAPFMKPLSAAFQDFLAMMPTIPA